MMKIKCAAFILYIITLCLHTKAQAEGAPQVNLEVEAESVAHVVVYYHDAPVTGHSINFPLPIHGLSQRFERVSEYFYVVGNVPQAEVSFSDSSFSLYATSGSENKINLAGSFVFDNKFSDAQKPLRVPVLKNISEATSSSGFKIHFMSEFLAGNYSQGSYANSFTLLVKPIL